MFLEKLFESVYGKIWLIILLVAILALIVYLLIKNEKREIVKKEADEEKNFNEDSVNANEESHVETENIEKDNREDIEEKTDDELPDYGEFVIVKGIDGFFRVRKKESERTIRKFATVIEAENYIEKRNLKND